MSKCDVRKVCDETKEYWDSYDEDNLDAHYTGYVQDLLPLEMACAQEHGDLPDEARVQKYNHLVFLVGHSPEPLLQSVWAYKPNQVSLIVNKKYGRSITGEDQATRLQKLIGLVAKQWECEIHVTTLKPIEAAPEQVFQTLLTNFKDTQSLLIDITGAKKSMTAGAFLFAAFADVPVSYVDFDDQAYDPEYRRPYGFGCQIRELENPFNTFALRDWGRVLDLYHRYKFREARILLAGPFENGAYAGGANTILGAMSKYMPNSREPIIKMAHILRGYELWDTGNYERAKETLATTPLKTVPSVIEVFGDDWVKTDGTEIALPTGIFDQPEQLCAYAYDELARIERMIRNDQNYRAAYLRAAGLNEVVMRARLVDLTAGETRQHLLSIINHTETPIRDVFLTFTELNPVPRGRLLKGRWVGEAVRPAQRMNRWWEISGNLFSQRKQNSQTGKWEDGWETFIHRRNMLAHTFASIDEKWAWDALAHVRANIDDFMQVKGVSVSVNAEALPWENLCDLTGIKAFLTPNLYTNPKEVPYE